MREALEADHGRARELWSRLRKPLDAIADGRMRALAADEVRDFVAHYRSHIASEEAALHELFERWIDERDRAHLGRSMRERRAQP